MSRLTLLVMAAGMGRRYGGLKQIDPVGPAGETIIDYSVYDAIRAGFQNLVFVIRKDFEPQFRATVGARFENRIAVQYAHQELEKLPHGFAVPAGRTKPWGTAHAMLVASEVIREPFVVINADDFYGAEGYRLLAEHLSSGGSEHAMVAFQLRNTLSDFGTVARGVCQTSADGYLSAVTELTKIERRDGAITDSSNPGRLVHLAGEEPVSLNMWGFMPSLFPHVNAGFQQFMARDGGNPQSEYYIPTVVNDLVAAGLVRVRVLRTTANWFGITYREDRPYVVQSIRTLIQNGMYPDKLWR